MDSRPATEQPHQQPAVRARRGLRWRASQQLVVPHRGAHARIGFEGGRFLRAREVVAH